jgi:hypothetical protein
MSEQAIKYLKENKGKYSSSDLARALRGAGYAPEDVNASIREVFPGEADTPPLVPKVADQSFWNFWDKKVYMNAWQKWLDFLFGVFAPGFLFLVFGVVFGNFNPYFNFEDMWGFFILAEIALLVYLWNRRRFVRWGIFAQIFLFPVVGILFFTLFFHF